MSLTHDVCNVDGMCQSLILHFYSGSFMDCKGYRLLGDLSHEHGRLLFQLSNTIYMPSIQEHT